jgi:netrin-G3 ligand
MEKVEDQQPVDIYNCVASLRTKRQEMVQTEAQYSFIHDAVLEALVCGNTQIPVESLRVAVSKLSKRNEKSQKTGYDGHFEVLQTTGQQTEKHLYKAGNQPAAAKKNRYRDILPLDTQRVILRLNNDDADSAYVNTEAGADYINASYLDGYRRRDAFITTQGPLAKTVNDFWKMVWEQNSLTIVMLTSLEENKEEMSYKYWPSSGSSQYEQYTVELQKETNLGEYVLRVLKISKDSETRTLS